MKLLIVNETECNGSSQVSVSMMADSTMMRSGMPFFIPDFAPHFGVTPMLALRVGRLGKCIAPRFAHRYIDAVSAAFIVTPLDHELSPINTDDMMRAFDGAAIMGSWTEFNPTKPLPSLKWSHNNEEHIINACDLAVNYERAIEHISRFCTIKMGDILCLKAQGATPQLVKVEDRIEAHVNDIAVVKSKIK